MEEKKISGAEALNQALDEEMSRDENIVIFGEDVGRFGGKNKVTKNLWLKYGPRRVVDTPLNEELFASIAIGAAQCGLRPVIEFAHGPFLTIDLNNIRRAGIWDWISAYQLRIPIVMLTNWRSAELGHELSSAVLSNILNLLGITIVIPSTPTQAKGLLKTALRENSPVIFLEHRLLYTKKETVPSGDYTYPFGNAEFRRHGRDLSIITYSALVDLVERSLAGFPYDIEILDLVSIKPLDYKKIVETARRTGKVLIVDGEPDEYNPLSAAIKSIIYKECPGINIYWLGAPKIPLPTGPLEGEIYIKHSDVIACVNGILHFP